MLKRMWIVLLATVLFAGCNEAADETAQRGPATLELLKEHIEAAFQEDDAAALVELAYADGVEPAFAAMFEEQVREVVVEPVAGVRLGDVPADAIRAFELEGVTYQATPTPIAEVAIDHDEAGENRTTFLAGERDGRYYIVQPVPAGE